jgi:hypothetical protein
VKASVQRKPAEDGFPAGAWWRLVSHGASNGQSPGQTDLDSAEIDGISQGDETEETASGNRDGRHRAEFRESVARETVPWVRTEQGLRRKHLLIHGGIPQHPRHAWLLRRLADGKMS